MVLGTSGHWPVVELGSVYALVGIAMVHKRDVVPLEGLEGIVRLEDVY